MTIASAQLHTYLTATYPGVRLSRNSCRTTAGGSISQHSAYGGPDPYHSNAIDVMGGPSGWTFDQNVELIQQIVDDIDSRRDRWSIRLILWQVHDHYGHAHVDFYPTMVWPEKWCGTLETPKWRFSHGGYVYSRNPMPENGLYDGGDDMAFEDLAAAEFDYWTDQNIIDAYDAGMFEDPNRDGFINYWTGPARQQLAVEEKARFIADYRAHLWKRGVL